MFGLANFSLCLDKQIKIRIVKNKGHFMRKVYALYVHQWNLRFFWNCFYTCTERQYSGCKLVFLPGLSSRWHFLQKCELGERFGLADGDTTCKVVCTIFGQALRENLGKSLKSRNHFKTVFKTILVGC